MSGTRLRSPVVLLALVACACSATARGIGAAPAPARQPSVTRDVVYGHKDGLALTFDVHRPAQPNGAGVIAIVSGGWQSSVEMGRLIVDGYLSPLLNEKGFTVFAVRHGSSPRYPMSAIMADMRRAVRFIRQHAGEYGVDPNRIGVYGGSAGGAGFDPMSKSGRKWLDRLASQLVATGTKVQHISNNAPFGLADFGTPEAEVRRKAGVAMAKRWLEGCAVLGVKSMRMNSPQALGPSIRPNAIPRSGDGYPRNLEIIPLMDAAIESYKEMADFGGNLGIKVTFENHWGLAADPMILRIMIDTINHPYCDATPDFCNWEHEYMLFNGLKALAPYSSSNVHAKYWDRWGDKNDVQRSVRIMLAGGFKGTFALEYEAGPLNGVEGAKYLYKEVLAALTTPAA